MIRALIIVAALTLGGCQTRTVIKEVPIEVKVPVTVPCMGAAPDPVEMLKDSMSREEWDALSTDQRDALIAAQALAWRTLAWQVSDASAGCR